MSKPYTARQALDLLRHDYSTEVNVLDRILGASLLLGPLVFGDVGSATLGLLSAKNETITQIKSLVSRVTSQAKSEPGRDRIQLLMAAHAVVVLASYFESLAETYDNFSVDLTLSNDEKEILATNATMRASDRPPQTRRRDSGDTREIPFPSSPLPFRDLRLRIHEYYRDLSAESMRFLRGLKEWDTLDDTTKSTLTQTIQEHVPQRAVQRYEEHYIWLQKSNLEFELWATQQERVAAAQALESVTSSLKGVETHLAALSESLPAAPRLADELRSVYRSELDAPLLREPAVSALDEANLKIPTVADGYVSPHYKCLEASESTTITDESTWHARQGCQDIDDFLAAFFTSFDGQDKPLVVLGHPGAGKSLLTKVLAARLDARRFCPLRVELRAVPADAPIVAQAEHQLHSQLGRSIDWASLADAADPATPVLLLDGLDELLQASNLNLGNYLENVKEFQERQKALGRPVCVMVTSRTVPMERVRLPREACVLHLEEFNSPQIKAWLTNWNAVNGAGKTTSYPVEFDTVWAHRELAVQPLLLLLLAIHQAEVGEVASEALHRSVLYERLVHRFLEREVDKEDCGLEGGATTDRVELLKFHLSLLAFSMISRGRQYVSSREIEADCHALERETDVSFGDIRPVSVVGRFFFVHESQALGGVDDLQRTYEFMHATFGEYFVARLIHSLVAEAIAERAAGSAVSPVRREASSAAQERLLFTLLSGGLVTGQDQVIDFLAELFSSSSSGLSRVVEVDSAEAGRFLEAESLRTLDGCVAGESNYGRGDLDYLMRAAYLSANLILSACALHHEGLCPDASESGGRVVINDLASWRRLGGLWRTQLPDSAWSTMVSKVAVAKSGEGLELAAAKDVGAWSEALKVSAASSLTADPVLDAFSTLVELLSPDHQALVELMLSGSSALTTLSRLALELSESQLDEIEVRTRSEEIQNSFALLEEVELGGPRTARAVLMPLLGVLASSSLDVPPGSGVDLVKATRKHWPSGADTEFYELVVIACLASFDDEEGRGEETRELLGDAFRIADIVHLVDARPRRALALARSLSESSFDSDDVAPELSNLLGYLDLEGAVREDPLAIEDALVVAAATVGGEWIVGEFSGEIGAVLQSSRVNTLPRWVLEWLVECAVVRGVMEVSAFGDGGSYASALHEALEGPEGRDAVESLGFSVATWRRVLELIEEGA